MLAIAMTVMVIGSCQPLRTVSPPPAGIPVVCAGALVPPFEVHIDSGMADPVWGTLVSDGSEIRILWPPGFSLRAFPNPAVLNPQGIVVAEGGQIIDDAGGALGEPIVLCAIGGVVYPLG